MVLVHHVPAPCLLRAWSSLHLALDDDALPPPPHGVRAMTEAEAAASVSAAAAASGFSSEAGASVAGIVLAPEGSSAAIGDSGSELHSVHDSDSGVIRVTARGRVLGLAGRAITDFGWWSDSITVRALRNGQLRLCAIRGSGGTTGNGNSDSTPATQTDDDSDDRNLLCDPPAVFGGGCVRVTSGAPLNLRCFVLECQRRTLRRRQVWSDLDGDDDDQDNGSGSQMNNSSLASAALSSRQSRHAVVQQRQFCVKSVCRATAVDFFRTQVSASLKNTYAQRTHGDHLHTPICFLVGSGNTWRRNSELKNDV